MYLEKQNGRDRKQGSPWDGIGIDCKGRAEMSVGDGNILEPGRCVVAQVICFLRVFFSPLPPDSWGALIKLSDFFINCFPQAYDRDVFRIS